MTGIQVEVKGVFIEQGESKNTGKPFFLFKVVEPVSKFVGYSNNQQAGQLADLAKSGLAVDLKLALVNNRLEFISAEPSQL